MESLREKAVANVASFERHLAEAKKRRTTTDIVKAEEALAKARAAASEQTLKHANQLQALEIGAWWLVILYDEGMSVLLL